MIEPDEPAEPSAGLLLDANLLVALTWPQHVLHRTAQEWFASRKEGWATTTITETALIRISMNPRVVAKPVTWVAALDMVQKLRETPGHRWWTGDVDLLETPLVRRAAVAGHGQVTDVHLAALARHHTGRLATLDRGVREALHPADRAVVLLLPM